jgi:hypothetical protein
MCAIDTGFGPIGSQIRRLFGRFICQSQQIAPVWQLSDAGHRSLVIHPICEQRSRKAWESCRPASAVRSAKVPDDMSPHRSAGSGHAGRSVCPAATRPAGSIGTAHARRRIPGRPLFSPAPIRLTYVCLKGWRQAMAGDWAHGDQRRTKSAPDHWKNRDRSRKPPGPWISRNCPGGEPPKARWAGSFGGQGKKARRNQRRAFPHVVHAPCGFSVPVILPITGRCYRGLEQGSGTDAIQQAPRSPRTIGFKMDRSASLRKGCPAKREEWSSCSPPLPLPPPLQR